VSLLLNIAEHKSPYRLADSLKHRPPTALNPETYGAQRARTYFLKVRM
jgi:hypothetical protein